MNTRNRILTYLKETHEITVEDDLDKDLYYDLGLDSLEIVEMIMWAEKHWGIIINDFEAEECDTLNNLSLKIDSKRCMCFTMAQVKVCSKTCWSLEEINVKAFNED